MSAHYADIAFTDDVAAGLAGDAILIVLVQLRLIPVYRRVPFGAGWWAYPFSYAAAFTLAVNRSGPQCVPGRTAWTAELFGPVSG